MTYALRPEGIEWPRHEDGRPSFRLEALAAANGIGHQSAHDALSDVRATIGLARLLRERKKRLYDWLFQLRDKRKAMALLDLQGRVPVLHTTRMYPSELGCTSLVMPLVQETRNKNSVLVYDLRHDPAPFLELDVEQLRARLFTRKDELPEGEERLPVKSVKVNKCPALAPIKVMDDAAAERISLDLNACRRHWKALQGEQRFIERLTEAYSGQEFGAIDDVDLALYDGFMDNQDRALFPRIRSLTPQQLAEAEFGFRDRRLPELLFRYRARNWPESLSADEMERWEAYRMKRLEEADGGGSITLERYGEEIAQLREERGDDADAQAILDALEEWGGNLV
jgi:exodeoxyribonuclease-1